MSFGKRDTDFENGQFPRVKKYLSSEHCFDKEICPDTTEEDIGSTVDSLLSKISEESSPVKRRVRHLNALAKVIRQIGPDSPDLKCRIWKIIESLKNTLSFAAKEVRAGALRILRYVLTSSEVFEIMLKLRVDFLVARSIDTPIVRDIERLQAFRFIRQVVTVCPLKLPSSLVSPLVSIVVSDSEPVDTMTWSSLATLAEILLTNPKLSCQCGVVQALLRGLLKSQNSRVSESIVMTLTHLYNHPDTRPYIRQHLDVQSLLAPLTDLHYRYLVDNIDTPFTKSFKERRIESARMAVTALFKSWPGIICLCSFDVCGISSFVEMLPLVDTFAQREMLDVLYEIFQLKVPVWTEDYREGVASIDPSQCLEEWSLDSGWVAEEGKALLPPKAIGRANLLDCYNAFILACFMESNLFPSLVQVVKISEPCISVMATILIGELLHLANSVLPAEYLGNSLSLPNLIASAMAFDSQEERNRATEVINCLNQVHQLKKDTVKPSSLYLKLSLEQTGYFSGKGSSDAQIMKTFYVSTEIDETTFQGHIRDSQVLVVKEFQAWNWNIIFSLLQHPYISTLSLTEDNSFGRFMRALTNFYKPDNRQFSSIVFSNKNSRKYSSVGLQLVKFLSKMESSEDGLLSGLVTDIVNQLKQVTASKLTSAVFSPASISNKLTRDYFLLLGAVSFHNSTILKQCKAYGPLLDICSIASRHDLHKLIIASLDFAHDILARVILEKLLTSGDEETRMYATRHMRILLRLNAPFFISWGMEMLIGQLYDLSPGIADEAIDILDEACEEESFLDVLVLQQPALLHLSEKGVSLFTRFVSVKRGYTMLSELGHLKNELEAWMKDYNFRYVSVAEQRLTESLTYYRRTQDGVYHRRSDTSATTHKAFLPVHFYGQLVKQEEGCLLLRNERHLDKLAVYLKQEPKTPEEMCQTKAAIWALGHIGTSAGGLHLLMEYNLVHDLVLVAQTSLVLSIRGTCYYAICLISKTSKGADILLSMGWTSVRHSKEEKWPVRFEEAIEEISTPSSPLSPTSSYASFGSSTDGGSFDQQIDTSPLKSSSLSAVELTTHFSKKSPSVARNASMTSVPVKKNNLSSKNYHLRPIRPTSLSSADQLDNFSPMDGSPYTRPCYLRVSRTGNRSSAGFLGVALPLQLQSLFVLDDATSDEYIGSRAYSVSTDVFDNDHNFILSCVLSDTQDKTKSHVQPNKDDQPVSDLNTNESRPSDRCPSPLVRQRRLPSSQALIESTNNVTNDNTKLNVQEQPTATITTTNTRDEDYDDTKEIVKSHVASVVSRGSISSTSTCTSGSIALDENSPDGKKLLHRECLEVIYNLSSDVSQKKNILHLNILFDKFPSLNQDIDLYWKAMLLLSTYPYKLNCRRYIQSKFNDLIFEKLISPHDATISTTNMNHNNMSPKMRRRSSTSDIDKFERRITDKFDTTSVTTLDEQDVVSEDATSLSSSDILGEEDRNTPVASLEELIEEKVETETVVLRTQNVADKGNRLSQLELPESNCENRMESVVEIEYDL